MSCIFDETTPHCNYCKISMKYVSIDKHRQIHGLLKKTEQIKKKGVDYARKEVSKIIIPDLANIICSYL
jgi:hypothetical protein